MSTPSATTISQMNRLAKRLESDHRFMAWVIAAYQKQERISNENLVNTLHITSDGLARLSLCHRPESNSASFANTIRQIAEYTGIDNITLANIIRQVESLEKLAQRPDPVQNRVELPAFQPANLLAAARDRTEDGTPTNDEQKAPQNEEDEGKKDGLAG